MFYAEVERAGKRREAEQMYELSEILQEKGVSHVLAMC
jgi:hypothetical protein